MQAGMVAFDTESWPMPNRRGMSRRRCCRAACVFHTIYEQCHKDGDVYDDEANAAFEQGKQARAWSRREILPSKDQAVSDCLTHTARTHARTRHLITLSPAQSTLARRAISITRYHKRCIDIHNNTSPPKHQQ